MLDKLKLAAYLDEVHDDPTTASNELLKFNIPYVVLRNSWGGVNVCDSVDDACKQLRASLTANQQTPIAIISNLGRVPVKQLPKITDQYIDHILHVVAYFKSPHVRISLGLGEPNDDIIDAWMDKITGKCIDLNIVPLYEPTDDASVLLPADIATKLNKFKRWKLLYDPSQLIRRRKLNPFIKYWVLLKKYTAAVDVRDYKIGTGFKPAGFGHTKIVDTIKDAAANNYDGWMFLEPGLGRRYASAVSRPETFALAMEAMRLI